MNQQKILKIIRQFTEAEALDSLERMALKTDPELDLEDEEDDLATEGANYEWNRSNVNFKFSKFQVK